MVTNLVLSATTVAGRAVPEVADRSPDMTGRRGGDPPWGSGWEVAVPRPDPPGQWSPHCQLKQ